MKRLAEFLNGQNVKNIHNGVVGLHDFQLKVSKIHQVFAKNQHDQHRIWSVSFLPTFFLQNTVKLGYSKKRMLKNVDIVNLCC